MPTVRTFSRGEGRECGWSDFGQALAPNVESVRWPVSQSGGETWVRILAAHDSEEEWRRIDDQVVHDAFTDNGQLGFSHACHSIWPQRLPSSCNF